MRSSLQEAVLAALHTQLEKLKSGVIQVAGVIDSLWNGIRGFF